MKRKIWIFTFLLVFIGYGWLVSQEATPEPVKPLFDQAIDIIKKYEGLHSTRHWPLVGYGHKVLPTDKFTKGKALTEKQADELLRADLKKLCAMYRSFGQDSILLATLAYNLGHGAVNRSTVYKKLKEGDRNIEENYLSHCRYKGKILNQLQRRRQEEFQTLFIPTILEKIEKLPEDIPEDPSEVILPYTSVIKG